MRQRDKQTDKQVDRQTDKQADRQTDKQTGRCDNFTVYVEESTCNPLHLSMKSSRATELLKAEQFMYCTCQGGLKKTLLY